MEKDTLAMLEQYITADDPRKWAKLSSTITYRRLVLVMLKEVLIELRALNERAASAGGLPEEHPDATQAGRI